MKKIAAASVLTLLLCSDFGTPAQANPITAPACRDVPSCVVTGTVVIGGVVYYLIKNTVTGVVHRVPARQIPPSEHRTNEQYEEEFFTNASSTRCHELADEYTARTGRKWRVKLNVPVRGTGGVSRPGHLLQWECTITDAPK